jgi:hypothetical protein
VRCNKANGENAAPSARACWSRLKIATDVIGVIGPSVPRRPQVFWSQSMRRPLVLVGCSSGYQQRSAWDLVQLRVRLGQWRKYLTAVTVRSGVVPRNARLDPTCLLYQARAEQFQPLVVFGSGSVELSACGVSPPTANLERWPILPESSVGRERLVRLSYNTADGDLNVASPL